MRAICNLSAVQQTVLRVKLILYSTQPMKSKWLICVPPGLTLKNATFCPQNAFTCFIFISEEIAISSIYCIERLVFVTETESVYCAVRTEYLNLFSVSFRLLAVPWITQLLAGLLLRTAGFDPRSAPVRFMVDKLALGQAFLSGYCGFLLSGSFHQCSILIY